MKTLVLIVALAAAAGLGGLGFYQHQQLNRLRAELSQLRAELETARLEAESAAADERLALAEQKARLLQATLSQATEVAADQHRQVSDLEHSLAAAKTNSNGLAGLFKDPEMREMIKQQQKAFMGPMIDKNYAALFKQLNLTPEQTAQVKELLEQKMLVAADMGMSMLDGSADASARKELAQKIKEETDARNDDLKALLGEDNYKSLETYEKSLPDRMSIGQFTDQNAGSALALDGAQEQQLIDAMSATRSGFTWSTDYNNQNPTDGNFAELFNEDRMNRHFEEQAQYNQLVLDRAKAFMRAEQLTAFEKFLETQRNMQIAAMKMAAKMFGGQQ
jgi:hypothetical protein